MARFSRIRAVALKEYKHILRDPFTLGIALALPLFLVMFFGFVIDLDYKNIKVMVYDNDKTQTSRRFADIFSSSGYFDVEKLDSIGQAEALLRRNNTAAVLIIKEDFGKNIARGEKGKAQLLLDGSDNAKAGVINSYLSGVVGRADILFSTSQTPAQNPVRTRFLFNPELNSRWFIVPALSTIIIGLLAIVLTALTVAKEWENGSMELLLSTPVRPVEIVAGKLFPYFLLNMFTIFTIFVISLTVFKIPFEGNFILYSFSCVIYVLGALALGLLISVVTRQQQAAIQFAFAVGLLPSFMLSGFIFPIENMPLFFRLVTMVFPQRWFLYISRTLFLSDAPAAALAIPFAAVTVFAAVMIIMSTIKFKKDVEP